MFGLWGGLAFGLCLASSPWLVAFSSIYWVLDLVLPLLVSTALGRKMLASNRQLLLPLLLLYAGFFYKFLSGYEFATTMVIAACAPLVYFGLRDKSASGAHSSSWSSSGQPRFSPSVRRDAACPESRETLSDGLRIVHRDGGKTGLTG